MSDKSTFQYQVETLNKCWLENVRKLKNVCEAAEDVMATFEQLQEEYLPLFKQLSEIINLKMDYDVFDLLGKVEGLEVPNLGTNKGEKAVPDSVTNLED